MRRAIAFVSFMLLMAACAAEPAGQPQSGLVGKVVMFPTCPVETLSSPCPRKGVQTTVAIESADGDRIEQVQTGPDGTFRVVLEPGDYLLGARPPPGQPDLVPRPASAKVLPGTFVRVTVVLDTRLREP
ncbi:MAG: hypothetical protein ACRDHB_10535 [Actinomycetota bacterium]